MELMELKKESALMAFTSESGLDPLVEEVRKFVNNFEHDLRTVASRAKTASLSAKVSKIKVKTDNLGKELVADWKSKAKLVDLSRKKMRDDLDELRDQARKPLTDWEDAEKARIKRHQDYILEIKEISDIEVLEAVEIGESFEEFLEEATTARDTRLLELRAEAKAEEDRIELEKLRKEAEDRRIADEKAEAETLEKLRLENEAKEYIRLEKIRLEDEAVEQERLRIEGEERAREKLAAEKLEAERLLVKREEEIKAKARREKEESERREIESERRANEAEANAKKKLEDDARAYRQAEEKREANKKHNKKIKTEAKISLMNLDISEEVAIKIITAIDNGEIMNCSIKY